MIIDHIGQFAKPVSFSRLAPLELESSVVIPALAAVGFRGGFWFGGNLYDKMALFGGDSVFLQREVS